MKLVKIDPNDALHLNVVYELLKERKPEEAINFKFPTWDEHVAFVRSEPHDAWYLIRVDDAQPNVHGNFVGSVYLTDLDEIGIAIFETQRRNGYATLAIEMLMAEHPRPRYLANINPRNLKSLELFSKLGFGWAACVLRRMNGATKGGAASGI